MTKPASAIKDPQVDLRREVMELTERVVALTRIENVLREHARTCKQRYERMTACDIDHFAKTEGMEAEHAAARVDEDIQYLYRQLEDRLAPKDENGALDDEDEDTPSPKKAKTPNVPCAWGHE